MKTLTSILAVAIFGLLAGCAVNHGAQHTAEATKVDSMIEHRDYTIVIRSMSPMRGGSVSTTSYFSLAIKGDSVVSYLPYYGRAYSLPYGGGDGLRFSAPYNDYTITRGKRDSWEVAFNARTREDLFRFSISIFSNGSASISVSSQNRDPINYMGNVDFPRKN